MSEHGVHTERDAIAHAIGRRLRVISSEAAIARLTPTGAWVVRVRDLTEALADPAVVATGIVRDVETRYGGHYRVVTEPLKLSESPLAFSRPAPMQGEHTHEVLGELGYEGSEIHALIESGAAYTASSNALASSTA